MRFKYIEIFYIFFLSILPLSINADNVDDTNLDIDNKIINMDLGIEESDTVSDIDSFFDISTPFFYNEKDFTVDHLENIQILSKLYAEIEKNSYDKEEYLKYLEIREYSVNLMRIYKKYSVNGRKNLFISVGSSPTPILAFIDVLGSLIEDNMQVNYDIKRLMEISEFLEVPFSKTLIYDPRIVSNPTNLKNMNSAEIYKNFFDLFDKYIDPNILKDKNIIIMDFTLSGTSLFYFTRLFLRYLNYKSIQTLPHVHIIRILPNTPFIQKLSEFDVVHVSNIRNTYPTLSFLLLGSAFDEFCKYPDYIDRIHEDKAVEVSSLYKDLVKQFITYMETDTKIINPCFNIFSK